jgi:hypothetical protein
MIGEQKEKIWPQVASLWFLSLPNISNDIDMELHGDSVTGVLS